MVSGRSIGSGPACHLASFYNPLSLILISPIKSVNAVARQLCGRFTDMLLEERFNNFEIIKNVKCPSIILHGMKDTMVNHEDSIEMLMNGFI